jgi:hypothetical protein
MYFHLKLIMRFLLIHRRLKCLPMFGIRQRHHRRQRNGRRRRLLQLQENQAK